MIVADGLGGGTYRLRTDIGTRPGQVNANNDDGSFTLADVTIR